MTNSRFWQSVLCFVFFSAVLIIFQLDKLSLPHYWDEAWVYATAIRTMAEGVPSMLPNALSIDLSRGHPLLFQFLGGTWMKIFGSTNTSAHSFALFITLAFIATSATFMLKELSFFETAMILALIIVQPIFIAQSAMLYPEMLLSLGLFLSLFGYAYRKSILFLSGLSISIFSKESALVFFLAFLGWELYSIFLGVSKIRELKKFIPLVFIIMIHPLSLYLEHGWFLYPEHTGLISLDSADVNYKIKKAFTFIFESQNRQWILFPIATIGVLTVKLKKWYFNILILIFAFSSYKILDGKWSVGAEAYRYVLLLCSALPLIIFGFTNRHLTLKPHHHILGVGYFCIIGFIAFSSLNFYTGRYLLPVILLSILMTGYIVWSSSLLKRPVKLLVLSSAILLSMYSSAFNRTQGESNLGLFDELRVQQNLANWLSSNEDRSSSLCSNFVTHDYLTNYKAGYLDRDKVFYGEFGDVCKGYCKEDAVVFSTTATCEQSDVDLSDYTLIYSDTIGVSFATVYKKQTP